MDDEDSEFSSDNFSTLSTKESENESCNSKPKAKSFVWQHFHDFYTETNNTRIRWTQCNYCTKMYKMTSQGKGSTGNMIAHLRMHHKDQVQQISSGALQQKPFVFSQNKFREALLKWVIVSDQPFTEPEKDSFMSVVHSLNPDARKVSNDTIKRDMLLSFESETRKLEAILSEVQGKISFTMDEWTSKNTISFMGIRGHWITEDWVLGGCIIDFCEIPDEHSGKKLCSSFLKSIGKYKLPFDKFLGFTMDNASNNDTFMDSLQDEAEKYFVAISKSQNRVRCLAHIINLSVQALLSSIKLSPTCEIFDWADDCAEPSDQDINSGDDELMKESEEDDLPVTTSTLLIIPIVEKLRKIVKRLRKSPQLMRKFRGFCNVHGIKFLSPIIDVKTRWNSTYKMICRAEMLKSPLLSLCSSVVSLNKFIISHFEWNELSTLKSLLQKFDRATEFFSMSRHPTISAYIPAFDWLLESLENFISLNSGELAEAAREAREKLLKYKPTIDSHQILFIATVLNPSLKLSYFKEHNYISRDIKDIKAAVTSTFEENYMTSFSHHGNIVTHSTEIEDEFLAHMNKRSKKQKPISQLTMYLNEKLAPPNENILDWWKSKAFEFDLLSLMARDYLSVQSTSVSNERDFSSGVDLVTPCRCTLDASTISASMCLKLWWK